MLFRSPQYNRLIEFSVLGNFILLDVQNGRQIAFFQRDGTPKIPSLERRRVRGFEIVIRSSNQPISPCRFPISIKFRVFFEAAFRRFDETKREAETRNKTYFLMLSALELQPIR